MADGVRYVCGSCGRDVMAWSDGNPYYIDERGLKVYAYHPDHEKLERCVGNDSPHMCLGCGEQFKVDSRSPIERCGMCGSDDLVATYVLNGRRCPFCKKGEFAADPKSYCIS